MRTILVIAFLIMSFTSQAQIATENGHICRQEVLDGDTIAVVSLDPAMIPAKRVFKSKREEKKYNRLKRRVIKVYPYAYTAGILMDGYEAELNKLETRKERKKYLESAEDALKDQFEGQIRDMSVTEGIILIKLIDRETGDSSYGLIQDLKGSLSAFMWQSVARIFGHNLKDDYDPYGEDQDIEDIVREIELGIIPVELPDAAALQADNFLRSR